MIKLKYKKVWSEIIKLNKKREVKILDVGARKKEFLLFRPKSLNFEIDYKGVDITEGFDICKMKLKEKFSYVLLLDVLEHLYDPLSGLKNIKSMMNSDSWLIVTVPNSTSWRRILKRGTERKDHLFSFTPNTLRNLLKYAGFKVSKLNYFSWFPKIHFETYEGRFSESLFALAMKVK